MNIIGQSVGVHLLVNVYDVPDVEKLKELVRGRPLLDEIVQALRLNVVAQAGHQFSPMGYSHAYVLSESHFTIHTYPEYRACYIDIFCCNPQFMSHLAVQKIKEVFETDNVTYTIMRR
jgi:S-adenosylmethionine decarboxylase proenzyme